MKALNELIGANSAVGSELLKANRRGELVSIDQNGPIAKYDQSGVDSVADTILALSALNSTAQSDDTIVLLRNAAIAHNKTAVCCYLLERADVLRKAYWELGAVLPQSVAERLSVHEKQFFAAYGNAARNVSKELGIDLGSDPELPPIDTQIEVRGGEDNVPDEDGNFAEVWTDSGPLSLNPAVMQFVERDPTVENLLRKGVLEQAERRL